MWLSLRLEDMLEFVEAFDIMEFLVLVDSSDMDL